MTDIAELFSRVDQLLREAGVPMFPDTFDGLAELYRTKGLEVTPPKGNAWYGKTMVCAEHDGVPYCMDAHGNLDSVDHGIKHRELTIARHHAKVKAIYDYCQALGVGDIWVLCGGGAQLQAFFGNKTGYLAILYLDLEDLGEQARMSDYLEVCGNKTFTLQVNWAKNDVLFENKFACPGVVLRTSKATYGE